MNDKQERERGETSSRLTAKEKRKDRPWEQDESILPSATPSDSQSSHLALVASDANNEALCKPLALALLQVASANKRSRLDSVGDKIAAALARTLECKKPKKLVHMVTNLEKSTTQELLSRVQHTVVVLTHNDITTMAAQIATSGSRQPIPKLIEHPLVKKTLAKLPADSGLLQQISIVLLVSQDEEDPATIAALSTKKKPAIPIFPCRPDEPISCQTVARMLWKRLKMGQGEKLDYASPLLFWN